MRRVLPFALTLTVAAGVIVAAAFSQSPGSPPPAATVAPAATSPATIHHHYHYHYHYVMPSSATYPSAYPSFYSSLYSGGVANSAYPVPPGSFTPSAASPYPPGYIPGPYSPLGFQNYNPSAPSAQGVIHVFLPTKDAVVYLNGQKMRGTGKDRKYTTPILQANREFQYWVTATFNQGGESVTQYRKAVLGAGEYTVADFTRPPEANPITLPAGPVNQNEAVPAQPQ
jgi:uncharacterized protein (TIGR03000 family)